MRGRKPKPVEVKKLAGNPGKRPLNTRAPEFPTWERSPRPPEHLSEQAKTEWRKIAPMLLEVGLLTRGDLAALSMYCQAWGDWIEAQEHLRKEDRIMAGDKGGLYWNPWVSLANKAWEQMRKVLPEFGLTPSSRSRMTVPTSEDEPSLAEQLFAMVASGGTNEPD